MVAELLSAQGDDNRGFRDGAMLFHAEQQPGLECLDHSSQGYRDPNLSATS